MPRLFAFANGFASSRFGFGSSPFGFAGSPMARKLHPFPRMDIVVNNRQRRVSLRLPWLRQAAKAALAECLHHSDDGLFALKQLPAVEVAMVSDEVIAQIHLDFMK